MDDVYITYFDEDEHVDNHDYGDNTKDNDHVNKNGHHGHNNGYLQENSSESYIGTSQFMSDEVRSSQITWDQGKANQGK